MTTNPYSAYTAYQVAESESEPNLRVILLRYAKHWPWFILSVAVALIAAYVYLLYQAPVYKVQASLLIKDEKKGMTDQSFMKELDIFTSSKVVDNEMEVLKSYTLMDRVVNKLGLDVQYYHPTKTIKQEIFTESPIRLIVEKPKADIYETELDIKFIDNKTVELNGQSYALNKSIQTPVGQLRIVPRRPLANTVEPLIATVAPHAQNIDNYLKNLKVEPTSKQSTVLVMSLEERVPAKGEAILNQLINEYNTEALIDKNREAKTTLDFLDDRLGLISGELATVEKDVERYKSTQGITDLSTQAQSFLSIVKDNDTQLSQVNIQLGALNDIERYIKSQSGNKGITPATLGLSDPVLLSLLAKLSELQSRQDEMSRTMAANSPLLQSVDNQIKATKASINENVQGIRNQLSSTRSQLTSTSRKMEGMLRTIPSKERGLLDVTRQQEIKNTQYTYLLAKREETALSAASTVADSRTVDKARTGSKPIKPVKLLIVLLFGIAGLLIPVGLISAKDTLNNRVSRRSDVEEVTHVPILGEVVKNERNEALIIAPRTNSVIAEQVRSLRTNLQFLRSTPKGSQVLLFTSSVSGEGKSFMSLNLGASMALVDRPTVILEMDLRKPKLHAAVGLPNPIGISNYLIGEASVDEILQRIPGYDNYYIITCGPIPPNPSELLSSPRLETLFTELRERFAYVIVDSPPIGLVTDAQLIAPYADATMYIVRHDYTLKTHLKMVEALHREQRFPKLNVILNAVSNGESYYYSYNSYNYGGYYTNEKKS